MTSTVSMASSSNPCRIVVVDDHAIMRDGLCAILGNESDLEVVGVADNGKGAIDEAGRHAPDLVVIDLSMPRTDGAQAIRVIKSRYPDIGVVVLTYHKEEAHIHSALDAGADAYVLKDDGRGDLLAAIRNGDASVLHDEAWPRLSHRYIDRKPTASSASSLWMIMATLTNQPGRILVKNSGNHRIKPEKPITPTPQKTAM